MAVPVDRLRLYIDDKEKSRPNLKDFKKKKTVCFLIYGLISMAVEEAGLAALWLECLLIFHFHFVISYFYLKGYLLNSVFSDNGISKENTQIIFCFPCGFLQKNPKT